MAITDKTAILKPPVFHVYFYDESNCNLDDLNSWIAGIYMPTFDQAHPAFQKDDQGNLRYFNGRDFSSTPVPDGWVILVNNIAQITMMSQDGFNKSYSLV